MRKTTALSAALTVAAVAAGCGSSAKSTTPASAPAGTAGTSAAPASSGYGSYGSTSTSQASSSTKTAAITTKHSKLGMILAVGGKKLTVYLFAADKGPQSVCTGACANVWPPVIGTPKASGQAVSADFGTIKRSDGKQQVTYKGHPLYTYVRDGDSGDAYGQGITSFGGPWYAVTPSGKAA